MSQYIGNNMTGLNDSINRMPSMVTTNQHQKGMAAASSKNSSAQAAQNDHSGRLSGAGRAVINGSDRNSRQNVSNSYMINANAAQTVGSAKVAQEQKQNVFNAKQQISNQNEMDKFIQVDLNKITNESLATKKSQGVPRKQGRMFQLSLGQENGPFQEKEIQGCPQIDKFATYSLSAIINKQRSPRIGILGQSTFPSEVDFQSQFQTGHQSKQIGGMSGNQSQDMLNASNGLSNMGRIDDVSNSVNKQIKVLEDSLVEGYDSLQLFKEDGDQIRKEIDVMMNVLIEKTEVVQDELHVETRKDYKELKSNIKQQRDENEILYKDLKKVVKDNEFQRSKIAIFKAKIEELEQHVGIMANATDYNEPEIVGTSAQAVDNTAGEQYETQESQEWEQNDNHQDTKHDEVQEHITSKRLVEQKAFGAKTQDNGTVYSTEAQTKLVPLVNNGEVSPLQAGSSMERLLQGSKDQQERNKIAPITAVLPKQIDLSASRNGEDINSVSAGSNLI